MPPPEALRSGAFVPAPELVTFAKTVFLAEGAPFYSETHSDIAEARIAYLWAGSSCKVRGREAARVTGGSPWPIECVRCGQGFREDGSPWGPSA